MFELGIVERGVKSAFLKQLIVRANFDDVAFVHDKDAVGILNGGQSMCDDKAGSSFHQAVHRLLNQYLHAGVDRTRRFVQNQHFGIGENRPGDCQKLFLPGRNVARLFVQYRFVSIGQCFDEVVDLRGLSGGFHHFVGCVQLPVADVVTNRAVVQPCVLKNHSEQTAQIVAFERLDFGAVDENRPFLDIVKPHQQFDDGGFSGPCRTDDGNFLTRLNLETEVLDDRRIRFVSKLDAIERNLRGNAVAISRVDGIFRFFRFFQQSEDFFRAGDGRLEGIGLRRDLTDRLRELPHVLDERLKIAEQDSSGGREEAAQHGDQNIPEVSDEHHDRLHDAREELAFPIGAVENFVVFGEGSDGLFFAVEGFDDQVIAVHFLDLTIQSADRFLLFLEILLALLHDRADQETRQRQHQHGDERHLPADGEHHHADAQDRRHRGDERGDSLRQTLVDGVDVVGDVREHVAVIVRIKVFERQAIDLRADVLAHLIGDVVGDLCHDESLEVVEDGTDKVKSEHDRRDAADGREVDVARVGDAGHDSLVKQLRRLTQNLGSGDHEHGGSERKDENDRDFETIRLQPLHQLFESTFKVFGLSGGHRHHHARSAAARRILRTLGIGLILIVISHERVPPLPIATRQFHNRSEKIEAVLDGFLWRRFGLDPSRGSDRRS